MAALSQGFAQGHGGELTQAQAGLESLTFGLHNDMVINDQRSSHMYDHTYAQFGVKFALPGFPSPSLVWARARCVEWPSGHVQELTNVAANQILTIREPAQLVPLGPREFQIRCWKGMKFEVEQSPDLQTWASLGVVTNETGTLIFQDTQGEPQTGGCFYRVVSR